MLRLLEFVMLMFVFAMILCFKVFGSSRVIAVSFLVVTNLLVLLGILRADEMLLTTTLLPAIS